MMQARTVWLTGLVLAIVSSIVVEPAARAELRRGPRVAGLRLGIRLPHAMKRLRALNPKELEQREREESFVPNKRFKAVEVRVRFDGKRAKRLPRKLRLYFYRDRLIGIRSYDSPPHEFAGLGKPDVASPDGKRRVWVDFKALRFAGCRRGHDRCEVIDLSYLVKGSKGKITRKEARDLLVKVTDRERQRATRRPPSAPVPGGSSSGATPPPAGSGETPVR